MLWTTFVTIYCLYVCVLEISKAQPAWNLSAGVRQDWTGFEATCIKGDRQRREAFVCAGFPQSWPCQQEYPLIHHQLPAFHLISGVSFTVVQNSMWKMQHRLDFPASPFEPTRLQMLSVVLETVFWRYTTLFQIVFVLGLLWWVITLFCWYHCWLCDSDSTTTSTVVQCRGLGNSLFFYHTVHAVPSMARPSPRESVLSPFHAVSACLCLPVGEHNLSMISVIFGCMWLSLCAFFL